MDGSLEAWVGTTDDGGDIAAARRRLEAEVEPLEDKWSFFGVRFLH